MAEVPLALKVAFTALLAVSTACAPSSEYPLTERTGGMDDPQLATGIDPRLISLSFHLSDQNPEALLLTSCFKREGYLRIIADEIHPRPLWLIDKARQRIKGCATESVFSGFKVGEKTRVRIQAVDAVAEGSQTMRTYKLTRTAEKLEAKYVDTETINTNMVRVGESPKQEVRFFAR